MAHWLDELEKIESRKHRTASSSARIQDKKFRIQQNYKKNKAVYDAFMLKLHKLAERVNSLPMEYREEFGKISAKAKETRLNNKLNYFSSSRRMQKMEFRSVLHPLKNVHYKHIRVIYFNVAKLMDKVEVEIREEYLEKKRRDGQVIPAKDPRNAVHHPHSEQNKFHEIYYYEVEELTDELSLQIIDWLAFHENVEHIPIVTKGEPRFKEA